MGGGKKKRKGNGHKATCKCPICKNMKKGGSRKSRKSRKIRKRITRSKRTRRGGRDIPPSSTPYDVYRTQSPSLNVFAAEPPPPPIPRLRRQ